MNFNLLSLLPNEVKMKIYYYFILFKGVERQDLYQQIKNYSFQKYYQSQIENTIHYNLYESYLRNAVINTFNNTQVYDTYFNIETVDYSNENTSLNDVGVSFNTSFNNSTYLFNESDIINDIYNEYEYDYNY